MFIPVAPRQTHTTATTYTESFRHRPPRYLDKQPKQEVTYYAFYFGVLNRWEPEVRSTPTFIRSLSMVIVRNAADGERLFEARVESIGSERQLPEVMPYLITALFSNFPGESGVTKVVTIEMD